MSERTLPVLTHPEFPQVLKEALGSACMIWPPSPLESTDEQRKEQNAALLVSLWNLGRTLSCSLCGMKDGQPGRIHIVNYEPVCLPCAEELFG
jgi:hypothetical protein